MDGYCPECRKRTRCLGIIHASSWMTCRFYTPQDSTSSQATEIEEHVSSGSLLPDHVVDHFLRMSEADVWAVRGGVRRAEEGGEGGRGAQSSLHMLHHWTCPLVTPLTHSPDLEIGAISPLTPPYVCIHVIHAACINRCKRAVSFIHSDLVRSP